MRIRPGEVYIVDLGFEGKERPMVVLSREDADAPRALAICAPVTTAFRGSQYEVSLGKLPFLRKASYVNVQGLQAIQYHELKKSIGRLESALLEQVRAAVRFALQL